VVMSSPGCMWILDQVVVISIKATQKDTCSPRGTVDCCLIVGGSIACLAIAAACGGAWQILGVGDDGEGKRLRR